VVVTLRELMHALTRWIGTNHRNLLALALSGPCIMQIGNISSRGKKDKSRFYQPIYNSSSKYIP